MLISSLQRQDKQNLEIWMFLKLQKMGFCTPKQELLIMQVLRYGKMSLTTPNQIFGLWDASFMKWLHFSHHLKLRIWKVYLNLLPLVSIHQSAKNFQRNSLISSNWCFNKNLNQGLRLRKYSLLHLYRKRLRSCKLNLLSRLKKINNF